MKRMPVLIATVGLLVSIACNLTAQQLSTPSFTDIVILTPAPTVPKTSSPNLTLDISLHSPVEPPDPITITIAMTDPDAAYCNWMLGDISGEIASGQLARGEIATAKVEVDWPTSPLLSSNRPLYIYGEGDDGSTFAQVIDAPLYNPSTLNPTATASCGYASFEVTTPTELTTEHPSSSFEVEIANKGLFQCGDLDWSVVEPLPQTGMLSCSPTNGILEGTEGPDELNTQNIQCAIDWDSIAPGQTKNLFLILFSYPRVNGTDSAHLITVRATKP